MFISKKGEALDILMHPGFVMFVAVLVLLYLLWFVHGIGSDMTYEKKFLATDLALTIDSLLASRDNVVLYYLPQAEDFVNVTYSFEKNKVSVFESSPSEKNAGIYYFTSDPDVFFVNSLLKIKSSEVFPRFSKIGSVLNIADAKKEGAVNIYSLVCPKKTYNLGNIVFDPAHGFDAKLDQGDKGFSSGSVYEYVLTREISSILRMLDTVGLISGFTRDSDIDLPVDVRINEIQDSVVSLHIGSVSGSDIFVKAYINYDSSVRDASQKLACELVNHVSSALINAGVKVSGVAVIPVVLSHESDSQFKILVENKPAVLLEVGNINMPMFSQDSKKAVASGIIEGVRNAVE